MNDLLVFIALQASAFLGVFIHWRFRFWSTTPRPKFIAFLKFNKPYFRKCILAQFAGVMGLFAAGTHEITLATIGIAFGVGMGINELVIKYTKIIMRTE